MADETDFSHLQEDLSPEDMRVVLGVFDADAKRLLVALEAAVTAGDPVTFKRVAHGLAGAAGAVGARTLEQTCRTAMARADLDALSMRGLADDIAARAHAAMALLAAFIARLDVPGGTAG